MSISYDAPENDLRRTQTLERILSVYAQDKVAGNTFVRTAVIDEAAAIQPVFKAAYDDLNNTLAQRAQAVLAKDEAFQLLEWGVRDAWESIKRRERRQKLGASVLIFYGLPQNGDVPKWIPYAEWLPRCEVVLEGDADAVAAGYQTLGDPTTAELQALYAAAKATYDVLPMADRAYDDAQAAVAALRGQVDAVLAKVVKDMRYNLGVVAEMDKESERRVMRGYGFTYITVGNSAEEAVDETLADPPTITPTP
jgi:hypothetical protein